MSAFAPTHLAGRVRVFPDPAALGVYGIPKVLEWVPEAVFLEELVSVLREVVVPASADGDERRVSPGHPRVGDCAQFAVVCGARQERGKCFGSIPRRSCGLVAHGWGPWGAEEDALENEAALARGWV